MWNPEFQGSGAIGDFVQFVSDEAGLDAVVEPNGDQLAELHAKWYQELLNEARGSDRPTTGWIGGLIVGAVTVLLAMLLALQNRRSKRREHLGPWAANHSSRTCGAGVDRRCARPRRTQLTVAEAELTLGSAAPVRTP